MFASPLRLVLVAAFAGATATPPASAQAALFEDAQVFSFRPGGGDGFGRAVGLHGGRLLVGARLASVGAPRSGEVQVFDLGPPVSFSFALSASDPEGNDNFGWVFGLDGDVIVVGANGHQHGTKGAGAAYVFRWNGTTWIEEAELLASDRAQDDGFGADVDVSGDTIVVGARHCEVAGVKSQGALYVFEYSAGTWTETHKLVAWDGVHGSRLGGVSVAIDGDLIAADASDPTTPYSEKAVYAFRRAGASWVPDQKFVTAPTSAPTFGEGLDVDGDVIAIGEPYGAGAEGIVHVYRHSGGTWSLEAQLEHQYGSGLDQLGFSVQLQGERLIAGIYADAVWGDFSGATAVFERSGGTWAERWRLIPSSGSAWEMLGAAVALDGDQAVVAGGQNGRACLYTLQPLVGASVCAGDGSAAPCPCGNESEPGLGFGCSNGYGFGASLAASGSTSVSADDLVLGALYMINHTPVLLAAAPGVAAGGMGVPFGDGLACLNGGRYGVGARLTTPIGGGLAVFGPGLGAQGLWGAGDTRFFQAWYRDRNSACGFHFNTTNALEVVFTP